MHCDLNATDNGALTSNAWTEKRSALAEHIAREPVIAEGDFAHHVGSNTLRLDLSCSLMASILAALLLSTASVLGLEAPNVLRTSSVL